MHASGSAPQVERVREQIAGRIERMPALAWRITKRGRRTVWACDPSFDPHDHVHEIRTPEGPTSLDETVDALLSAPLPEQSPRWGVWLIHGYCDREYALFYRAHHAAQDGQAALDALTALFGTESPAPVGLAAGRAQGRSWWRRIPARAITRTLNDTVKDLRPTMRWSPQRALTGRPRLQSAVVPSSWLRETGRALGAGGNDVCLAALAQALRSWVPESWIEDDQRGRELHVSLPVGLREPEERFMVGNRVSAVRIPLSFWEDSPAARVAAIARATGPAKTDGMRQVLRAQLRLPEWLVYRFVRHSAQARNGLEASGLMRLTGRLAMGTDPVETVVATQFLYGEHLFGVAFLSYGDKVVASVTVDRALDDRGNLAALWADAVERLWHETVVSTEEPIRTSAPQP